MTLGLNTSGLDYPSNLEICQWLPRLLSGVEGAATHDYSATDPSSGATATWGSREAGRIWVDIGVDGSTSQPVLKMWRLLSTGPDVYGWKRMCGLYHKRLTAKQAITFSPAGPFSSDEPASGWNTLSLATLLDGAGVQDVDLHRVVEVEIDFQVQTDANFGSAYLELRTPSGTNEIRIYPQVSGVPVHARAWVLLDSSEQFDWRVITGSGTPSFSLAANLLAFKELQ